LKAYAYISAVQHHRLILGFLRELAKYLQFM